LALQDYWGLGLGLTTPPWIENVTKTEEATAGWLKPLKKARVHAGLSSCDDDGFAEPAASIRDGNRSRKE
jgi:hypothetical protein